MAQIVFRDMNDASEVRLELIEQTTLGGQTYVLVSDPGSETDESADAYIMRAVREDGADVIYEEVDDDVLLGTLSGIFEELAEDVHFA